MKVNNLKSAIYNLKSRVEFPQQIRFQIYHFTFADWNLNPSTGLCNLRSEIFHLKFRSLPCRPHSTLPVGAIMAS